MAAAAVAVAVATSVAAVNSGDASNSGGEISLLIFNLLLLPVLPNHQFVVCRNGCVRYQNG